MKVLVIGGQGMLGHKMFQVLQTRHDTYATFRSKYGLWQQLPFYEDDSRTLGGVDVFNFDTVINAMAVVKPDVVINCVGIIKQLDDASNPIMSLEINAVFPHRLAILCQISGARMITMSTDCVFSGKTGNYTEKDVPDAIDLYGRTKLLGELIKPNCLTIRTSIIGRDFFKSVGLLEWFLKNRGKTIKGYKKAVFSGLTTIELARLAVDLLEKHTTLSGLYHVASKPINKFDLLMKIKEKANLEVNIEPNEDVTIDRSLNTHRFLTETNQNIPTWDQMLEDLVAEMPIYDQWRFANGIT